LSEDLNHGYKKPTEGDESNQVWMDIISDDIERFADHSHDGIDSTLLTVVSGDTKYTYNIDAGKVELTTASYTSGAATANIGAAAVTAGMFGYGDDIALEASVLSVTGGIATMSSNFTATKSGNGELTFSDYKKVDNSTWEKTLTLPAGMVSREYFPNLYIDSAGEYQYAKVDPVMYLESNTVRFQVSDDQYDYVLKLI
jgi:hypothetical protein